VQLRLETYNAFNHHDWTGIAATPQYVSPTNLTLSNLPLGISTLTNSTGAIVSGGRFGYGALTGAASPRRTQLSLKIYF
jgi:hypothetical protein